MRTPGKLGIAAAVGVAIALVGFGLVARAARPTAEPLRLASMAESAEVMKRAGATMQAHGQTMLATGQRTGDQNLVAHGEHWLRDGQELIQSGIWMGMNPAAPGSLVSSPSELAAQGNWSELTRAAQSMIHDPSRAQVRDVDALRWNGQAMRAEGRNMVEHGRVMLEEVEEMIARHGIGPQAATELRHATMAMQRVGSTLEQNGQAMIDYASRVRRGMGYR